MPINDTYQSPKYNLDKAKAELAKAKSELSEWLLKKHYMQEKFESLNTAIYEASAQVTLASGNTDYWEKVIKNAKK